MNFLDPGRPATCSRSLFSSIRREDLEIRVRLLEPETFIVRSGLVCGCGWGCCWEKNASELEHDDDDDDVIEAVKMEEDLEDSDGTLNNAKAASAPKIIIDRCNVFDFVDDVEILMEGRVTNNHHIMARHDDAGVVRVDFLIIIVVVKLLLLLVLILILLLCIRLTSTQIKGCNRVR